MSPMLDPKHTHTPQEQTLWDHMEHGEWDQIDTLRQAQHDTDLTPPDVLADAFVVDERNAHAHYQDAHEPPQSQRETNGRAHCSAENEHAGGPHNMALFGLDPSEKPKAGAATVRALGTHFNPSADVFLDGKAIPKKDVKFIDTTEVTFVVQATQAAGTFGVYVQVGPVNSIALPFTVQP